MKMASKIAHFAQVAEVERWWKVCIDVHLQSLFHQEIQNFLSRLRLHLVGLFGNKPAKSL